MITHVYPCIHHRAIYLIVVFQKLIYYAANRTGNRPFILWHVENLFRIYPVKICLFSLFTYNHKETDGPSILIKHSCCNFEENQITVGLPVIFSYLCIQFLLPVY